MKFSRLISFLTVCLAHLLLGQAAQGQRLHTRVYSESDGLPSSVIYSITQDASGRMFFDTRAGVVIYDGQSWEIQQFPGPIARRRFCLTRSPAGTVWAAEVLSGRRIFQRDGDQWRVHPSPFPHGSGDGRLTAIAANENAAGEQFLVCDGDNETFLWSKNKWTLVETRFDDQVHQIAICGTQFILCGKRGLYSVDPNSTTPRIKRIMGLPSTAPFALAEVPGHQSLRIAGWGWIGELTGGRFKILHQNVPFNPRPKSRDNTFICDENGGYFLGNRRSSYYFHPSHGLRPIDLNSGFSSDTVTCGFLDREGLIWLGSLRGLTKVYSQEWVAHDSRTGLADDEVTAVVELRDGTMVLAHPDSLTLKGRETLTVQLPGRLEFDRINNLVEAPNGDLLLACTELGLQRYSRLDGSIKNIPLPGSLSDVSCTYVNYDEQGNLCAITHEYVLRLVEGRWVVLNTPDDLTTNYRRQLIPGENGALLVSTSGTGVVEAGVYHPRQWLASDSELANNIVCLTKRENGEYWAGTLAGLYRLTSDERLEKVNLEGLSTDLPVYFITDDPEGNTWIGTDSGVLRWDGEKMRHFRVRDGLLGTETNRAAGICDSKGRMWIGTERGVNVFDPRFSPPEIRGPQLELSSSNERPGKALDKREHHQNTLIYKLHTLSFLDEAQVRHQTWLEGYDQDWSSPRRLDSPTLLYANLPPGRYRLRALAIDVNGNRSEEVISGWTRILPPLWGRPWFIVLCTISALLLFGTAAALVSQHRFSSELEERVASRTADLATEKSRLEQTVTKIADGVVLLDSAGKIALWNRAAELITGWAAEDSEGMSLFERFGVRNWGANDAFDATTITVADGTHRVLEASAADLGNPLDDRSRVIAFRDATARIRNEQNLAKAHHLESLGKLAGGIAHDFNNLLTVVLGNVSMIEGTGPDHKKQFSSINAAVQQARSLTHQLITFAGGGEPVRRVSDLGPVIREATQLVQPGSRLRHELEIAPNLDPIEMDAAQMIQVFQNLLLNADQAMNGQGTIHLRARNSVRLEAGLESRQVIIEVRDEGHGISPQIIHRIFEPYFSTKEEGTGLGLATAHSIVKRHGGRLTVNSKPGRGTTFKLVFPSAEFPDSRDPLPVREKPKAGYSILIMDDEQSVRDVTQGMLQSLGHRCKTTSHGQDAVEAFQQAELAQEPFDLVILDLTVPGGMGGEMTLEHILAIDPNVPAIVMSGYSSEPIMARFGDYGFRGRLSKPYGIADLRQEIELALE